MPYDQCEDEGGAQGDTHNEVAGESEIDFGYTFKGFDMLACQGDFESFDVSHQVLNFATTNDWEDMSCLVH